MAYKETDIIVESNNIQIELTDFVTFWSSIVGQPSSNTALVSYLNTLLATKQDLFYYIVATEADKDLISNKKTGTVAFVKATKNLYIYYSEEGTTPEWIMLIRDLSSYYTKSETDALLALKANIADVYSKIEADGRFATITNLNTHINNTQNPHNVSKAQVGLSNVDNTSDLNKPISTATQTALNNEANTRASEDTSIRNSIKDGKLYIQKNGVTVATFSANQAGDTTANIVADTPAWGNITGTLSNQTDLQDALDLKANQTSLETEIENRTNADTLLQGQITTINNTISGYGNIVTHNVNEFATSVQGALADTAIQPNDNITKLTNNAGYITKAVNNLDNYMLTTDINTALDTKVGKNNAITGATKTKITYDSKGLVTAGADLIESDIPSLHLSKISDITSTAQEVNYLTGTTSNIQGQINLKLNISDVINNVTTTTTNQALSANMGKELQDQINNLKQRGRYLSVWDCTLGKAETTPTVNPYTYKAGDYFLVGVVASQGGTNYRPNGATYDKDVPSTTVETGSVVVNDAYYYDGTSWTLLHTEQPTVAFSTLAGSPYDNANLTSALNAKVTANNNITGATKTKITYDSKGLVTGGTDLTASDIPNLTLSKITDVTATASEVNILDGATLTTTELNYVDGVTSNIQTQLNGKQPTGNYVSYTNNTATIAGTSKTVSKTSPECLFVNNGLIMGGTAASAGLVTRGICGVVTPDSTTGACTKDNLYLNYDGNDTNNPNGRGIVINAGSVGTNLGSGMYSYCATRGDVVKTWVEAKGYTTNIGTITGITMNGTSKGTSGVIDLGTVITSLSGYATETYVNNHHDSTKYDASNPNGYQTGSQVTTAITTATSNVERTTNRVTTLTSSSTNIQYPSAKCVYDIVGDVESALLALRGNV